MNGLATLEVQQQGLPENGVARAFWWRHGLLRYPGAVGLVVLLFSAHRSDHERYTPNGKIQKPPVRQPGACWYEDQHH